MRVIFEEDIENCDFLEIILSVSEMEIMGIKGIVEEFRNGLYGKRHLNIHIRVDEKEETI